MYILRQKNATDNQYFLTQHPAGRKLHTHRVDFAKTFEALDDVEEWLIANYATLTAADFYYEILWVEDEDTRVFPGTWNHVLTPFLIFFGAIIVSAILMRIV